MYVYASSAVCANIDECVCVTVRWWISCDWERMYVTCLVCRDWVLCDHCVTLSVQTDTQCCCVLCSDVWVVCNCILCSLFIILHYDLCVYIMNDKLCVNDDKINHSISWILPSYCVMLLDSGAGRGTPSDSDNDMEELAFCKCWCISNINYHKYQTTHQ